MSVWVILSIVSIVVGLGCWFFSFSTFLASIRGDEVSDIRIDLSMWGIIVFLILLALGIAGLIIFAT